MNNNKMFTCVVLNLLIATSLCASAPGTLDTTFNPSGVPPGTVTTPIGTSSQGRSVAIQPDGAIVVAGFATVVGFVVRFAVDRYNTDGSLDTSFNGTGTQTTQIGEGNAEGRSVALQSDGKIVVAGVAVDGASHFTVARYNSDGSLDTSFNNGGPLPGTVITPIGVTSAANGVAIQTDGKIVVVGQTNLGSGAVFAVARYNSDGSLDTSFNGTGIQTTLIGLLGAIGTAVTLQADGKIVVAGFSTDGIGGTDFAVARYNIDGSLDTSFSNSGTPPGTVITSFGALTTSEAFAVDMQQDGKIVVAGFVDNSFALVRYNSDGTLDVSFNGTGTVATLIGVSLSKAKGVVVQPDGKIVAAGETFDGVGGFDFALARYNSNGSLDVSFGSSGTPPGTVITTIGTNAQGFSVALQSDRKIVVAGEALQAGVNRFAVARYNGDPISNLCALRFINKYGPRLL